MDSCDQSSDGKGVTSHIPAKRDHHVKTRHMPKLNESQIFSDDIQLPHCRPICRDESLWLEKVKQVMELTRKSEDEVVMALHDSDGDLNRAVNDLLEGICPGWSVKKKKVRQPQMAKFTSSSEISNGDSIWKKDGATLQNTRVRASIISRGWRRHENKENEKNMEGTKRQINHGYSKRGRGVISRSGRGGRGGSRSGYRTFINRTELLGNSNLQHFSNTIDTWTGPEIRIESSKLPSSEPWNVPDSNEEWENEEYTGSLADTKVFTPSLGIDEEKISSERDVGNRILSNRITDISDGPIHEVQRLSRPRPRIPPPSRIPSTAVEMPRDSLNSTIGILDVQFGALDFGNDAVLTEGRIQDNSDLPGYHEIDTELSPDQSPEISKASESGEMHNQVLSATKPREVQVDGQMIHPGDPQDASRGSVDTSTSPLVAEKKIDDVDSRSTYSPSYNATIVSKSNSQTFVSTGQGSNFTPYSSSDSSQATFTCQSSVTSESNSFPGIVAVTQANFNSLYNQSCSSDFNQSPISKTSAAYDQSTSSYKSSSAATNLEAPQFETSTPSNIISTSQSYIGATYQNTSLYQSTAQTFPSSSSSFSSTINQGPSSHSNTAQSVYSGTYNYGNHSHTRSQDMKSDTSKEMQFKCVTTAAMSSLSVPATCSLGPSPVPANTPQTKTTCIASTKALASNPSSSSLNSLASGAASGNSGNITPILGHQYIMGQSVPYAAFQQPHMYSYEDLQLIQQRLPHLPTTGFYDATMGYQTTGSATNLGNSRSESIPSVQGVQNVAPVQGQFTNLSDTRFNRSDNDSSPAPSTISQTAAQHQQPLMNAIPPGYAYFYGGGLMPTSGFQYSTPAMYPPIPTASNSGATTGVYNTKSGSYSSGYTSATNYEPLTRSGSPGDFKSSGGYPNSQPNKNCASSGNSSSSISTSEITQASYTKSHISLNKTFEKQSFHTATPPPFNLNSNQNANVINGYGTTHLFIPTVPHQLHQPLHPEISNNTNQRATVNSQSKTQAKSGYGPSYWTGGN